jgi:hypothetical protein
VTLTLARPTNIEYDFMEIDPVAGLPELNKKAAEIISGLIT